MSFLSKTLGLSTKQDVPSEAREAGSHDDKIVLLSFPRSLSSVISTSPFTGKLELMLRIAGLQYEGVTGDVTTKKHAPKTKFPVLRHGATTVSDSSCIVRYLTSTYPAEMAVFTPKTPQGTALAGALQRMLEEHTYFCYMYHRWQRDDEWAVFYPLIFSHLPTALKAVVPPIARSAVLRDIHGQGIGRHSLEEVNERMEQDFDVCEKLLAADSQFLTGGTPTAADCFLFGLVELALNAWPEDSPVKCPVTEILKTKTNILALHERLRSKYWPDGTSTEWVKVVDKPLAAPAPDKAAVPGEADETAAA